MIYVCGVYDDGILYVIDTVTYQTAQGAKKRCEKLNTESSSNKWVVLYQDRFKVYEGA